MKRRKKMQPANCVYYIVLTIVAVILLIPFIWMVSTSFDYVQSYGLPYPPRFLPETPSLFNYKIAMNNMPLLKYLMNTVIITALTVVLNLFIASLAGYGLSKGKFKGKAVLLVLILSNMMIPFETKMLPTYEIVHGMGLSNNYLGVVLPSVLTSAIYIFFAKKYCDDLPDDLYEAGVIDGAGKFRIYLQIFLPLMGPALATVAILTIIACWNDLLWPMIVLTKNEMKTLQIGLALYSTDTGTAIHAGMATAMSVISILPLSAIYIFLQRYIVQSIAFSGIKQ